MKQFQRKERVEQLRERAKEQKRVQKTNTPQAAPAQARENEKVGSISAPLIMTRLPGKITNTEKDEVMVDILRRNLKTEYEAIGDLDIVIMPGLRLKKTIQALEALLNQPLSELVFRKCVLDNLVKAKNAFNDFIILRHEKSRHRATEAMSHLLLEKHWVQSQLAYGDEYNVDTFVNNLKSACNDTDCLLTERWGQLQVTAKAISLTKLKCLEYAPELLEMTTDILSQASPHQKPISPEGMQLQLDAYSFRLNQIAKPYARAVKHEERRTIARGVKNA